MHHPITTAAAASAVAALMVGATAPGAAADPLDEPGEHCVLEVIGADEDGRFITATPRCFDTLEEALEDAGLPMGDEGSSPWAALESSAVAATGTIGVHFDGTSRTGASITVTGADCGGGYLNLSTDWTNRISSTWNGCPKVTFFDGFDKSGSAHVTGLSTVNLGGFSDMANSISYAAT